MPSRIIIGADLVPTKSNYELFREGNVEKLIGSDLKSVLNQADFTIFNLEVPLTDKETPIVKCGPNLIAPTYTINGLKAINPYFFTLANNHILDQGEQGLISTENVLKENGIAFSGVGSNLEEASKPYVADINGTKLGIYCCAEHEFSIATKSRHGANPFDPLYSFDHVRELKENTDIVIVLYHGGKEHYRYPSPELQRIFHKFAEVGADYVIAQHTHCIGCVEEYLDSTLVYGQGNFLFDDSESEYWKTSMLLSLNIDGKVHSCEFIPLVKRGNTVSMARNDAAKRIFADLQKRNNEIKEDGFIDHNYRKYAEEMRNGYYVRLSGGIGRLFVVRVINRLSHYHFMNLLYNKKSLLSIENCFQCEAHRELVTLIANGSMVGDSDES